MSFQTECYTEYDKLELVLLCEPKYMAIREVINQTQEIYKEQGIDKHLAIEQHRHFVKTLREHDVNVVLLQAVEQYAEQVFTRDIGFTLGDTVYVAEMAYDIRKGEENIFKTWLKNEELSYYDLVGNKIEGGDVLIDQSTIYIGISNRTNEEAIQEIKTLMPQFEVIPLPFHKKFLHIDCVFNILSAKEALIYPNAFQESEWNILNGRYHLIEVTEEEQFHLGTNVLSIGNNKVISLPQNSRINRELSKRGYDVIEVDISEIIKSGGSFRCCTLPLKRQLQKKTT